MNNKLLIVAVIVLSSLMYSESKAQCPDGNCAVRVPVLVAPIAPPARKLGRVVKRKERSVISSRTINVDREYSYVTDVSKSRVRRICIFNRMLDRMAMRIQNRRARRASK